MRFDSEALWERLRLEAAAAAGGTADPFRSLGEGAAAIERQDLDWACERLIIEVAAPAASLDLTAPAAAEHLLLARVRNEIGAEVYPNADRTAVDVAEALIRAARSARQGALTITAPELLRRARLRSDFGAVARAHPVDRAIEISRAPTVEDLVHAATAASEGGKAILVVGPPGQGKSWICQQFVEELARRDWLIAEHYCYLGDADNDRLPRVLAEAVFGSLLNRVAEYDPRLVSDQRPRFAADEQALIDAVSAALRRRPDRRVALVVDGIDHVTRVRAGDSTFDPSFTLAESLASLDLPSGSVLVVLSQPGGHLLPLERVGAVKVPVPSLTEAELRRLAGRLGVVPRGTSGDGNASIHVPILADDAAVDDFVVALSERSAGNALYATYLCREALRTPTTIAAPSTIVRSLPAFDGSLLSYYQHIHASLGDEGAWVADVIAFLDFPVTRAELKEIRPDMAHRVDQALTVLEPVLIERAAQRGVRVYHESFARFLRQPFQDHPAARIALADRIIEWLEEKGVFEDSRAFRYLLPMLAEADHDHRVVDTISHDFVVRAVAAGFPASAIMSNLATGVGSAQRVGNWPAIVRFVEMSRSAETYQEERFESTIVNFVDVAGTLLGADTVSERLLHDGRPVMAARAGLQMCAAIDALGAVAPWREYMTAFLRESEHDNTMYGEDSDRRVNLAWLRGRLRLSSLSGGAVPGIVQERIPRNTGQDGSRDEDHDEGDLAAPANWKRVARLLDRGELPAAAVVDIIFDTFGLATVVAFIEKLSNPGSFCLALAERIAAGKIPNSEGYAHHWASVAARHGLPPGNGWRLIALGIDISQLASQSVSDSRERFLDLARAVQSSSVRVESQLIQKWMDACTLAARRDPVGLAAAEALIEGPGWYSCWLRFTIALVRAEAAPAIEQSEFALGSFKLLTEVQDPFLGEPRACDLYPIHDVIYESIQRAVSLTNDETWGEALGILNDVSASISTTLFGEMGGPIPRDRLLHLAVDTATSTRRSAAEAMVRNEIENGGARRYYADLAEYRLLGARLALKKGDSAEARRLWLNACQLLIGYGWHKDITIYELLNPLPTLISANPDRGRTCVAKVQPLCERIPLHTDRKETRGAWGRWWELLALADPNALAELTALSLLSSCNNPNGLLHGARFDLWRAWHDRADPILSGALRLTLEEGLDSHDVAGLRALADISDGTGRDAAGRFMAALLARIDERPYRYGVSNSTELLERDRQLVDELNGVAERAGAPRITPLPGISSEADDTIALPKRSFEFGAKRQRLEQTAVMFSRSAIGLAQAIRAWRTRRCDEMRPEWATDRFANIFGYRLIELAAAAREQDAAAALELIAEAGGFADRSGMLNALAEGLERHQQIRLAVMAYTLAWTRARGHGGWLTFGGETEIESLRHAAELDRALALKTISAEIARIIAAGGGTYGISQALIFGFARGGLGDSECLGREAAFSMWDEAFAVIANRAPRVAASDDPDEIYTPPDPDSGLELLGDLNAAFGKAAIAGLAHPAREQKRRSLVAAQVLLHERPSEAAPAFQTAVLSLSDPATLTWLLRMLELASKRAEPVLSECVEAFQKLATRPHLTIRALSRRLLGDREVPLPPSDEPDTALLERHSSSLWLPPSADIEEQDAGWVSKLVQAAAGCRILSAEVILPRLGDAVRARVRTAGTGEEYRRRLDAQLDAYGDRVEERWPNAYLAPQEVVEDALQRAAAGGRAARIVNGLPLVDPVAWEDVLAQALLDDPEWPVIVEHTRQPRPDFPPPPARHVSVWSDIRARANAESSETGASAYIERDGLLLATIATSPAETSPVLAGGVYSGWRLVATVERRIISPLDRSRGGDCFAERYRIIELRDPEDVQALNLPPVTSGDLRAWREPLACTLALNRLHTQPIIGVDFEFSVVGDGRKGLGIQAPLLTPTPWLIDILGLQPGIHCALNDGDGPAVALITWRTEYETSDYHLAWPRLCGAGMVVRSDAFDGLVQSTQEKLVHRDFLVGSVDLCSDGSYH